MGFRPQRLSRGRGRPISSHMGERGEKFERSSGRSLPAGYRTFINAFEGGPRLKESPTQAEGQGALEYRLSTADELLAPYALEGTEIIRPFFSAHILHLARLRDAGVLIFDGGSTGVSPERFESMNTVGVGNTAANWEKNEAPTHLLVLDPADGSLRSVPVDPPAVVRKVADSFDKWLKAAKRKPRKTTAKAGKPKAKPKKAKAPTPTTLLAAFKRKNKLTLPMPYAKFLKAHDGVTTFPGAAGEQWQLATLAELADPTLGTAHTPEGPVPAFRLTRVYADAVQKETGAKFVPVFGTKQKFTLARMRKALCVGHCNGDPLFLDPTTKYSVWGYSREGRYVGKVADSFALFLKPKAKKAATAARKPRAKRAAKPATKSAAAKPAAKAAAEVAAKVTTAAVKPATAAVKPATAALKPAAKATKARAPRKAATAVNAPAPAPAAAPAAPKRAA